MARYFRYFLAAVLAAGFVSSVGAIVVPISAALDGPSDIIIPEDGQEHDFGFTLHNTGGVALDLTSPSLTIVVGPGVTSGDPSDGIFSTTQKAGTCPLSLAPGANCEIVVLGFTPEDGSLDTDADFGITPFSIRFEGLASGSGFVLPTAIGAITEFVGEVKVTDPGFVPEPATLALLGLGLAGLAASRRRKLN